MDLYIGCPIWSFKGWVGTLYPEGTKPSGFLKEYARRLTAVEGNTTFYAVPARKTLEAWVEETPGTFRFCAKIPRAISHAGRLSQGIARGHEFGEVMTHLGSRLGPMFLQLPPGYSPAYLDDLKSFLEAWPRDMRLAVEVRHPAWFDPPHHQKLNGLLAEHGMARVVIDTRPIRSLDGDAILRGSVYQTLLEARAKKPDVPVIMERTTEFLFVRYIGHPDPARNSTRLEEWAEFLAREIGGGADAYVFCHSPGNMAAPYLCRELHRLVAARAGLPPLPWEDRKPDTPEQVRMF